MNLPTLLPTAVAVVLLVAGCGVSRSTSDAGAAGPESAAAVAASPREAGPPGSGPDRASAPLAVPQDVGLDLAARHPGGTVLLVSGMRFEGTAVIVGAEFVNGADRDVEVRLRGDSRLRLLDDLGTTYNVVIPDGADDRLELATGASVTGDLVFVGPLDPRATTLTLVANAFDDELPLQFDLLTDLDTAPQFALEGLDLHW